MRHEPTAATIARLLVIGGPANILRSVWAVVVDPIKAVLSRWSVSNIFEERWEGVAPAFTDGDSSRAVTMERVVARIRAASEHPLPGRVFLGSVVAVGGVSGDSHVSGKAPAAVRHPFGQARTEYRLLCSAVTATQPIRLVSSVVCARDNCPPSKRPASQIIERRRSNKANLSPPFVHAGSATENLNSVDHAARPQEEWYATLGAIGRDFGHRRDSLRLTIIPRISPVYRWVMNGHG